jgi:hypothetical protein
MIEIAGGLAVKVEMTASESTHALYEARWK